MNRILRFANCERFISPYAAFKRNDDGSGPLKMFQRIDPNTSVTDAIIEGLIRNWFFLHLIADCHGHCENTVSNTCVTKYSFAVDCHGTFQQDGGRRFCTFIAFDGRRCAFTQWTSHFFKSNKFQFLKKKKRNSMGLR